MRRLLFLGWIGSLLACQKEIEIDLAPQSPKLAVYSILQPDSLMAVWVTQTKSIQDNLPVNAVDEATVTVTPEGQSSQVLTLTDADQGRYQADFQPQPGVAYHLSVTAEGYPPVEATTRVPLPVAVQQVNYEAQRLPNPDSCGGCPDLLVDYRIALTFEDPASQENYYEVVGWMDYLSEYYAYDSVTGALDTLRFSSTERLNLRSTDPAASSVEEAIVEFEPDRYYYQALRFTDRLFNGNPYTFDFRTVNNENPTRIKVVLRTYHEAAHRYERAKEAQRAYAFDALLYEPVQLPMNIRGGYGIFSSFSQDSVVIELDE